jgi:hypothetical protein
MALRREAVVQETVTQTVEKRRWMIVQETLRMKNADLRKKVADSWALTWMWGFRV